MMKARFVACILFILCFLSGAHSQTTCPPNLDFESGDFTNWECFIGTTDTIGGKNRMNLHSSLPVPGRHTIIAAASNPGNDYYGGFPRICPYGGNYSVKLGNEGTGAEAEGISYTFVVPTSVDTFTFTYFYAVVLEDPAHNPPEQPRFFVTAYDVETGDLINCASFDYVSTAGLPGFQKSPVNSQILYKSWTPTSLQFAGLGGHTVRLEFRTADCTRSGHFGYAYMDVASACSNILATAPYCIETNSLILDAPFGFQTYNWYNSDFSARVGSGQSITLSPPPVTQGVFYVDVIPYPGFGCRDTLQAFVKPYPVPDTPQVVTPVTYCQNATPDPLSAKVLPGHQLMWYTSPTGGIPTSTAPKPPTNAAGTFKYYVSQKALYGCEGFRTEITVQVIATPVASFTTNNIRQCLATNNFLLASNSTNLSSPEYIWDFGNGKADTTTNTSTNHSYATAGNYTVKLKVTNEKTCSAEKTQPVTLIPKPIASFAYPDPICEMQTVVTFTDRSSVPTGVANISSWWWNINGSMVSVQSPGSFTSPPGGPFFVQQLVTTVEGCRSDTNNIKLTIHPHPLPEFTIGDLLCDNEIIHFRDRSLTPAASVGETISKWNWTFDNATTASDQNPNLSFNTGIHNAMLVSATMYGCTSQPVMHSFEIFPKPITKLDVSDSCVNVPITFTAADLLGNVDKWYWNLGGYGRNLLEGTSSNTRSYTYEGDYTVTLLGQTSKGCKDTIIRAIMIYDNKSTAGRDTAAPYNEPIELNAHGEPNMQYTWTPATGLDHPDVEKPVATYNRDQLYQLYTITEKGCRKQTQVLVKRYAGPELYLPNAFSPNKDGVNDVLRVLPTGIRSFGFLAIYNRWGQLVYRTTDYTKGWDGTYNGMNADPGTFVYIIQATDYKGRPLNRKGTVVLIR